jgi:hypothetical protein
MEGNDDDAGDDKTTRRVLSEEFVDESDDKDEAAIER